MDERNVKRRQDMRWQRTERHLMGEFGKAIAATSIDKITVAGLSRAAEINKATFYLHYRDVYDLASAYVEAQAARVVQEMEDHLVSFFTNPREFVEALVTTMEREMGSGTAEALAGNHLVPQFMNFLTQLLGERFQAIRPVPKGAEPDIVISFFLHGTLGALAQHRDVDHNTLVNAVSELLIALEEHGRTRAATERVSGRAGR